MENQKVSLPSSDDIKKQVKGQKRSLVWVVLVLVALAGAAGGVYVWQRPDATQLSYRTEKAEQGDIVSQAAATGTLEPTRTVSVGAEISGLIATVDVEDNDQVKVGQVLATFDKTTLESQLDVAKARLSSANASIRGAKASFEASITEKNRTQKLADSGVVASADLDTVVTTEIRSRAQLDQVKAEAEQARANLGEVELKLQKAVIVSPIDGVVLKRNVEPGQTVAASLQAPELFVVAEDLAQMTLRVWIDEADIGLVKAGQSATFEVSAWPTRQFQATVEKLSLSPTTTNNVVTYAAELKVDNSEGLLRPGMTANANVVTGKRENVLKVPNAALRFKPETQAAANAGSPLVFTPGRRPNGRQSQAKSSGEGTVYVLRAGQPVEVKVKIGVSDGRFTEVVGGEVAAGDEVIVGQSSAKPGAKP